MKKKALLLISFLLLFSIAITSSYAAPVDKQIFYSKKTKLVYPKTYTIRFSLWDNPTSTDPANMVWSEQESIQLKTSSKITSYLGDSNPLDSVNFAQQLWVQVDRVKAGPAYVQIGTRDKLRVVPYALWSETASAGGSGDITGVTAGTGLTGGGTTGDVTLDANIGTTAGTVAAGEHTHDYSSSFVSKAGDTMTGNLIMDTGAGGDLTISEDKLSAPGNLTVEATNNTADTTISITNPDATYKANLNVEGIVTATSFTGDGSGLTNVNPSAHTHSGDDITAGTVADTYIDSTIARDSEINSAISIHTANASAHHTRYTDAEAVSAIMAAGGSGSGLDADLLDGQHASAFATASGSSSYIQNQDTVSQSANFNISGTGTIGGNMSAGGNTLNVVGASVGIGTTSPSYPLHVSGDIYSSSYTHGNAGLCIGADCRTAWPAGTVSGSGTANYVPKWTGAASLGDSLIYDKGTSVGIGTISPLARLHTQAPDAIAGTGTITSAGTSVTGNSTIFTTQLNVGDTITAVGQSRTVTAISSDAYLSINSPFEPPLFNIPFTYQQPVIRLSDSSGVSRFVVSSQGSVRIGTGGLLVDGNVGIGTTVPYYRLEVYRDDGVTAGEHQISYVGGANAAGILSGYRADGATRTGGFIRSLSGMDISIGAGFTYAQAINISNTSGNVGIGTPSPGSKVSVQAGGNDYYLTMSENEAGSADMVRFQIAPGSGTPTTRYGWMMFNFGSGANILNQRSAPLTFGTANLERMRIDAAGNVGIGTTSPNPAYKLHVNGDAAGTSWTNISSREYKENIKKVDDSVHADMLARLMKLDLTTYNYKEEFGGDKTAKLGFIAEEMPEEVLSKDGKGVDVYELLAFTIGAMKAQQKQIEELKARLKELQ